MIFRNHSAINFKNLIMKEVNEMRTLTIDEMKKIDAGATAKCKCGRTFKDEKFLFWVISSAKSQLNAHKKYCYMYR